MDERDPRISLQTKPAQLDKKRFHVEWHLPLEPGLPTHAALLDLQTPSPELIAESVGGDESETLLNLWTIAMDAGASDEEVGFLADAYSKRPGDRPDRTRSVKE